MYFTVDLKNRKADALREFHDILNCAMSNNEMEIIRTNLINMRTGMLRKKFPDY